MIERAARPDSNSLGRPIAATPEALSNFWQWFAGSKVVDRQGRPLVVYHGTKAEIRAFDPKFVNTNTKTGIPANTFVFSKSHDVAQSYAGQTTKDWGFETDKEREHYEKLIHDDDIEAAIAYSKTHMRPNIKRYAEGGNVMPVYLRILKPLKINARGDNWSNIYYQNDEWDTNHLMAFAQEKGYDGLIVRNVHDRQEGTGQQSDIFAVFAANQIKSAVSNTGTFQPNELIGEQV